MSHRDLEAKIANSYDVGLPGPDGSSASASERSLFCLQAEGLRLYFERQDITAVRPLAQPQSNGALGERLSSHPTHRIRIPPPIGIDWFRLSDTVPNYSLRVCFTAEPGEFELGAHSASWVNFDELVFQQLPACVGPKASAALEAIVLSDCSFGYKTSAQRLGQALALFSSNS